MKVALKGMMMTRNKHIPTTQNRYPSPLEGTQTHVVNGSRPSPSSTGTQPRSASRAARYASTSAKAMLAAPRTASLCGRDRIQRGDCGALKGPCATNSLSALAERSRTEDARTVDASEVEGLVPLGLQGRRENHEAKT